jgi:hypothetical protein
MPIDYWLMTIPPIRFLAKDAKAAKGFEQLEGRAPARPDALDQAPTMQPILRSGLSCANAMMEPTWTTSSPPSS